MVGTLAAGGGRLNVPGSYGVARDSYRALRGVYGTLCGP